MIHVETITLDSFEYQRTYSDSFLIERDGEVYEEAIDPIDSGRTYTESDIPLGTNEVTAEDYQAVLAEMGVDLT